MLFRHIKKGLGIWLIFAGACLILVNATLTGAVIGFGKENLLGLLGFLVFIIGGIFLFRRNPDEKKEGGLETITINEFAERTQKKMAAPGAVLVLDTSAVRAYYSLDDLRSYLNRFQEIIVPTSVLQEIHYMGPKATYEDNTGLTEKQIYFKEIRKLVDKKSKVDEGYEGYLRQAYEILDRTEKPRIGRALMHYVEEAYRVGPEKMTEQRKAVIAEDIERQTGVLENMDMPDAKALMRLKNWPEKLKEYLDKLAVSEADTDVLAYALHTIHTGYEAVIGERDKDLRQAANIVRDEYSEGRLIDIVEPAPREFILRPATKKPVKRLVEEPYSA